MTMANRVNRQWRLATRPDREAGAGEESGDVFIRRACPALWRQPLLVLLDRTQHGGVHRVGTLPRFAAELDGPGLVRPETEIQTIKQEGQIGHLFGAACKP